MHKIVKEVFHKTSSQDEVFHKTSKILVIVIKLRDFYKALNTF